MNWKADAVADKAGLMRDVLVEEYLEMTDDSCIALLPQVLRIAAEFGIADQLADGPMDTDRLAGVVGADPDSLYRLLRAMASVGLVAEVAPRCFELAASGQRLRSGAINSVRESVVQNESYLAWAQASSAFRSGNPVSLGGSDQDFFGHKDDDSSSNRSFMRRMREQAHSYGHFGSLVDWHRSKVVMDVGGCDGYLLAQVLRQADHLTGVLFDRPSVIEEVKGSGNLDEYAGRVVLNGGDFFAKIPAGADTHMMCCVLHDWTDEQATVILTRSREAIEPDGRLFIIEMVVPDGDRWHPSKWRDLGMMVLTGGRERTEAEYRDLLSRAGYSLSKITEIPGSYHSLIEAVPGI